MTEKATAPLLMQRKQEIIENTTFVISGHNIKWFAILATESLILNCNIPRDNVWYFDDNSTDGTKEELLRRSINIMTWVPEIFERFLASPLCEDLPVRVSQIQKSAIKQVKSKYVCFFDGDVVHFGNTVDYMLTLICEKEKHLGKEIDIMGFVPGVPLLEGYHDIGYRVTNNYLFMNIEAMKSVGFEGEDIIEIEMLYDKYGNSVFDKGYDTGNCLYYKLKDSSAVTLFYEMARSKEVLNVQYLGAHLRWVSSSMRMDPYSCENEAALHGIMLNFLKSPKTQALCNEIGVDVRIILKDYLENFGKSPSK